jgi:hypothetical protein
MESKEKTITFNPGIKHDFENKKDLKAWEEQYNNLSREDKILLETQEQTKQLTRISNNVAFFFWLTVLSVGLSILVLYIIPNI